MPTEPLGPETTLVPTGAVELGATEHAYIAAARAANTVKGYRSDWAEWTAWCHAHGIVSLPADPRAVAKYLSTLARHGAKVGTMSRRLSSIRYAHQSAGLPAPLDDATLAAVWEGIRRTHGAPPDQALPLMPPLLWECLAATPTLRPDGTPNLAGLRDHVALLVGFVGALRRSELCAIDVEHLEPHAKGLVVHIPKSKNNQTGETDQLVILPSSPTLGRCPVAAILAWRRAAHIDKGPLLRGLKRNGQPRATPISHQAITDLVQAAVARAGTDPAGYSAHSLRAGFVTWANLLGQSDRAIARQTRHKSLQSIAPYVRIADAWTNNAATAV